MQRKGGARYAEVVRLLGVHRETLNQTLDTLAGQGFLRQAGGYGHSLRPELVLTPRGVRIGPPAVDLIEALDGLGLEGVLLRKWALPIVALLLQGDLRYADLARSLPGVSPRALTLILKELIKAEVVQRHVGQEYPPTVRYGLGQRGRSIASRLQALAERLSA